LGFTLVPEHPVRSGIAAPNPKGLTVTGITITEELLPLCSHQANCCRQSQPQSGGPIFIQVPPSLCCSKLLSRVLPNVPWLLVWCGSL